MSPDQVADLLVSAALAADGGSCVSCTIEVLEQASLIAPTLPYADAVRRATPDDEREDYPWVELAAWAAKHATHRG